ncbi:putative pentatricopeptide repeat-containing protein At5g37570 isoform X4 [Prosopis cineraria]|uniref:putative pentatricopeptide repeat-containing protein At5g37570 isoform X4 n=1 Tax=Prosopis cineraria TaxID=364024 RepID=UPI00240FBE13|nr:putative pentatricopeptide repeat-containing protein At5g37570 isoform X4 [Prosopis cineraria]
MVKLVDGGPRTRSSILEQKKQSNRTFNKCWRFLPMLSIHQCSLAPSGYRLLKFSDSSITSLLRFCKTIGHLNQVHAQIISKGLEQDHYVIAKFISLSNSLAPLNYSCMFVGTSLIDMYGKCRKTSDARKVFDEMTERNVVSWTAMVVGYVAVGNVVEAKRLFDVMPQKNVASWNAMIQGFVKMGDLGSARGVFDSMPEKNVVSFTTMIDAYARSGDMVSARLLFDQSSDKDLVAWSVLISGYVQNGQPNAALLIFLEMESLNVKPDEFILVSLMSACSQLGCIELTQWVDSYVSKSFIDLQQNHVMAALMDMNAKSGNLERALKLFENMPKRDVISYCSMIQGLSIHGHGVEAINLFNKMLTEGLVPDEVAFTIILTACSHSGLVDEGSNQTKKWCIRTKLDNVCEPNST